MATASSLIFLPETTEEYPYILSETVLSLELLIVLNTFFIFLDPLELGVVMSIVPLFTM